MLKDKQSKNNMYLIMFYPLLFVLLPFPSSSGLQALTYPILLSILLFIGFRWYLNSKLNVRTTNLLALLFIYAIVIALSIVFSGNVKLSSFFQIAKPFYFAVILLFGLFAARMNDEKSIIRGLLNASYIILLAQLITGLGQVYGITILDPIYSAEKSRPLGQLVRTVGTTGNPNTFGWIVIQSTVIITLFETQKVKKLIWVSAATVLLVLSGSRSMLLMLPVVLIGSILLATRKNVMFYLIKVPFYLALMGLSFYALIQFIRSYGDVFPYLNQLLVLIDGDSLSGINSFDMRTFMWEQALHNYAEHSGLLTWMFGLGAGTYSVMDNAYLYAVINMGFVGLAIILSVYIALIFIFKRVKNIKFKALGYQYVIFSLILGYQADTISGWLYPSFALFYGGIALALIEKQKSPDYTAVTGEVTDEKIKQKKKRKRYKLVW